MSGEKVYYLYNGHGDVTALINAYGSIITTYYYDAFGVLLEESGEYLNPIRYAGYYYDDESKLYDCRARFYDAKLARFMQEDTYRGSPEDPLSLNLYMYCYNNPMVYYDPTGHYVSEWDTNYVTNAGDLAKLALNTLLWNLGNATGSQALKDTAHSSSEAIRDKYRIDGESGTSDGNTVSTRTGGVSESASSGSSSSGSGSSGGGTATTKDTAGIIETHRLNIVTTGFSGTLLSLLQEQSGGSYTKMIDLDTLVRQYRARVLEQISLGGHDDHYVVLVQGVEVYLFRGADGKYEISEAELLKKLENAKQDISAPTTVSGVWHSPNGYITTNSDGSHNGWGGYSGKNTSLPAGSHMGVDLAITGNVKAIYAGKVVQAEYRDGNGYIVTIKHEIDGVVFYSFYAHLQKDSFFVEVEDEVSAGDNLGKMGNTGGNYGIHLHLGVYSGSLSTNPLGAYRGEDGKSSKQTMGTSAIERGYVESGGRTFFDPIKVIDTKGQLIINTIKR